MDDSLSPEVIPAVEDWLTSASKKGIASSGSPATQSTVATYALHFIPRARNRSQVLQNSELSWQEA